MSKNRKQWFPLIIVMYGFYGTHTIEVQATRIIYCSYFQGPKYFMGIIMIKNGYLQYFVQLYTCCTLCIIQLRTAATSEFPSTPEEITQILFEQRRVLGYKT